MPFLVHHREQIALNSGRHHNIEPNEGSAAVVVGDKALQHTFRRTVQHSSSGSEKLAVRSEMYVALQTVFELQMRASST